MFILPHDISIIIMRNLNMTTKRVLTLKEDAQYISLSKSTINRREDIGDFPTGIWLTGNRKGFLLEEIDEWINSRPREKAPEVNDNKKSVRCPTTIEELDHDRHLQYTRMKKLKDS